MTEAEPADTTPAEPATELEHGGRLEALRRSFPDAPTPLLDLSTGINPVPYPVPTLPPAAWTRLPEPGEEASLREAAALAYGVADPSCVVAAPGTQILIGLLPALLPRAAGLGGVRVLGPTYGEHLASWRQAGVAAAEVGTVDALRGAGCAVLCQPNNPDGRRLATETILGLADAANERGGIVVVDEAFADFDPGCSVASALPHPALVVLRSFGKAYGLAGLRLGFALTTPRRAGAWRAALGPWAVSGAGLAIGRQALADTAWRARAAERLARDAAWLDRLLLDADLDVVGGTVLFRLASTPNAAAIHDALGRTGIAVRRFSAHPHWLRFGIPADDGAFERLRSALRA